jgi:LPXTG-motif cell wall-anchored protein
VNQPTTTDEEDETNVGVTVGIILGVVVLLILLALIYYLFKKRKDNGVNNDGSMTGLGFNPNNTDAQINNFVEMYGNNYQ